MKIDTFCWVFREVCSSGCDLLEVKNGLDNGSAPNRRQAIILTQFSFA